MYHYVYRLDYEETGEFYFGSRTSNVHPTLDCYLGSMVKWKPNKSKLIKTILKSDFSNRGDCILYEREMILINKDNPLIRNYAIPGFGSNTVGFSTYVDKNGKHFHLSTNDELVINGEFTHISKGITTRIINEETEKHRREQISKTLKGRPKPETFVENMKKNRIGENNPYSKYLKENNKVHHASKKVYQYNQKNELINEWDNASIASKNLGINRTGINNCCNNKTKTSGDFIWKYDLILINT